MNVSECCGSIPWNDTHVCFECGKYAKFINYVEYNTQILRSINVNERILKLIKKRLEIGQKKYGHENVETDGRDFIVEALEEILDCCVYVAAKLVTIKEFEIKPDPTVDEPISNCCYVLFTYPGWPDSDLCSKCGEHADILKEK